MRDDGYYAHIIIIILNLAKEINGIILTKTTFLQHYQVIIYTMQRYVNEKPFPIIALYEISILERFVKNKFKGYFFVFYRNLVKSVL